MRADTNSRNLNQSSASGHLSDPTIADIDAERLDHLLIVKLIFNRTHKIIPECQ